MKNLLYILLISAITTFTACSNDDSYSQPNNVEKAYTVNFKIKDPFFNIEESNLKSWFSKDSMIVRAYFYKKENEVITNYKADTINLNNITNNSFNFSVDLLPGKYYAAFVGTKNFTFVDQGTAYKYSTHYYEARKWISPTKPVGFHENKDVFFNNFEIDVVKDQSTQEKIVELNPMWSYVNINISDAKTFDLPEGTTAIEFDIKPRYVGFGIANKLATEPYTINEEADIINIETLRANSTFTYTAALSETEGNNNLSISIKYLKKDGDSTVLLETRELKIPQTTLKNGYNYNINGALGSKDGSQSFNISLGSFSKEDVVIDF